MTDDFNDSRNRKVFIIRNVLNLLFVIAGIVGIVVYLKYDREIGTYIIMGAFVLKFAESAIRLIIK